ncbi:hypothetical protein ACIRPT_21055 [Streptomyces sp. NPDC101227]|uniref:hypothetical protein n=1 Tax=Streptomyces sp. NPDC101227 TaxID=3366136 RepID=UPI0038070196
MSRTLTYPRTATYIAERARMALGAYNAVPTTYGARDLHHRIQDMCGYAYFAVQNGEGSDWQSFSDQLISVLRRLDEAGSVAVTNPQHAIRGAQDVIAGFERAAGIGQQRPLTPPPYDQHGHYNPAPGTEYPFSVADVGYAAVQLLGPTWQTEPVPWGVGAYLQHDAETYGYLMLVDTECDPSSHGQLYICDDLNSGSRSYLPDATAADGLDALASLVADTVRSLRDAD